MRRAYVESHEPFPRALAQALQWAGDSATIHAPDTRSIEENRLHELRIRVTSPSSKSRFYGRPEGTVVATFLNLSEVLEVERRGGIEGLVVGSRERTVTLSRGAAPRPVGDCFQPRTPRRTRDRAYCVGAGSHAGGHP